jgi:hypothetical protein
MSYGEHLGAAQRSFSLELLRKLALLGQSPVRFDGESGAFVDKATGVRRRGLTRLLAQLVPVPNDTLDSAEVAAAESRSLKPRRSKYDPAPEPLLSSYSGELVSRCASCSEAHRYMAQNAPSTSVRDRLAAEIHPDIAHGLVVDAQLELYVRCGSRSAFFRQCAVVDPCVGTLLAHFDASGISIVATQLPLYSATMGVATQFDIVLTDRATRTRLILGEIKATRGAALSRRALVSSGGGGGGTRTTGALAALTAANQASVAAAAALNRGNLQYERLRGRLTRTTLRGMPLSYYSRHQIQLFCMLDMVQTTQGFTFDEAAVFRVSPGVVRTYPLNPYYVERAATIVRAIAAKSGVKRKRGSSSSAVGPTAGSAESRRV